MNLDEKVNGNKFTMQILNVDVRWNFGLPWAEVYSEPELMITPWRVIRVVSRLANLSEKQLLERTKKYRISHPRQIAMLIVREGCAKYSLHEIGRQFGMDHSSALYGIRRAQKVISEPGEWQDLYLRAKAVLEVKP